MSDSTDTDETRVTVNIEDYPLPVGEDARRMALEDLEDVVRADLGVLAEVQGERVGEGVDEEVKELVFVDFVVCLLVWSHTLSKQTFQLTSFVRY